MTAESNHPVDLFVEDHSAELVELADELDMGESRVVALNVGGGHLVIRIGKTRQGKVYRFPGGRREP